jgi:hypothetical protein
VLRAPAGVPSVTVGRPRSSAAARRLGGSGRGYPRQSRPIVAVIVLGAKGWTVADIARQRP